MNYYIYHHGAKKKVNSAQVSGTQVTDSSVLIIKFRGGLSERAIQFNKANGMLKKKAWRKEEQIYLCYFKKMSLRKLAALSTSYHKAGIAEFAEPYVQHRIGNAALTLNDPLFTSQWIFENAGQNGGVAGEDIGILEGLSLIAASGISLQNNICVAVLDEGVDIQHPDLKDGNLWHNNFSVFGNGLNPKPKSEDVHGTAVAGIIAAIQNNNIGAAGINPYCKLMAGKLYYSYPQPFADPLNLEYGIRKAVDDGARVINLSWKVAYSPLVASAIEYGFNRNVVFCVAAGNYDADTEQSVRFPGSMDEVITVGACNNRAEWINLSNSPAGYKFGSCYGRELDLVAPGLYITTTVNKGKYITNFFGTSAATAIVSAVAAILLAINPQLSNVQVRDILLSTADVVAGDSGIPYFHRVGHGKINAFKAIENAIASTGS
ncbi:MAG: S8 family serine peptidase [Chitinophagaceae bacterium]|jgi:thermitase|nr:S8 family serine peptidase [Chitinophagaceae bacterium]